MAFQPIAFQPAFQQVAINRPIGRIAFRVYSIGHIAFRLIDIGRTAFRVLAKKIKFEIS